MSLTYELALEGGAETSPAPRRSARTWLLVVCAYLFLSVVVWWHVWTGNPTVDSACPCGDPGWITWFLAWPAYAIRHGLNPFYSSFTLHPIGINLLSNTSAEAYGVLLAPVTWVFGPIVTLNVALTLSPALSALAMYWLLRRWCGWAPAAFFGGLLYGFSPFMLVGLSVAHLQQAGLMVAPLIVGCFDELIACRRHHPVTVGVVLGLLLCVQFFVATEFLFIVLFVAAIAVALLVAYGAVYNRRELTIRTPSAALGFATGAGVSCALLAYPAWFALAGPAHVAGKIWDNALFFGTSLRNLFLTSNSGPFSNLYRIGGYSGRPLPSLSFLGVGIIAMAVVGVVLWRRDRRLVLFGALAIVAIALSLRSSNGGLPWVPWKLVSNLPIFENVLPERFMAAGTLCAAVILGLVLDHSHGALGSILSSADLSAGRARFLRYGAVLGLVAIAFEPLAQVEFPILPLATSAVAVPPWFATTALRAPPGTVILDGDVADVGSVLVWQARANMRYALANGTWQAGLSTRASKYRGGYETLVKYGAPIGPQQAPSRREVLSLRDVLRTWKVDVVVVPEQVDRIGSTNTGTRPRRHALTRSIAERQRVPLVALLTEAIGRAPVLQNHAVVWWGAVEGHPVVIPTPDVAAACAREARPAPHPMLTEGQCLLHR